MGVQLVSPVPEYPGGQAMQILPSKVSTHPTSGSHPPLFTKHSAEEHKERVHLCEKKRERERERKNKRNWNYGMGSFQRREEVHHQSNIDWFENKSVESFRLDTVNL
jgi:hypothetical protein